MRFDWLTSGGILPFNPAASVHSPKHVVKRSKTSVLAAMGARQLFDSIDTGTLIGLRDRALIGVMVYFLRPRLRLPQHAGRGADGADLNNKARLQTYISIVSDTNQPSGDCMHSEVPAHHNAADYMDAYIDAAKIAGERTSPS